MNLLLKTEVLFIWSADYSNKIIKKLKEVFPVDIISIISHRPCLDDTEIGTGTGLEGQHQVPGMEPRPQPTDRNKSTNISHLFKSPSRTNSCRASGETSPSHSVMLPSN